MIFVTSLQSINIHTYNEKMKYTFNVKQPIICVIELKSFVYFQREQMIEAQEMFRTSNKVTRPEKALILGFMAGSRGRTTY